MGNNIIILIFFLLGYKKGYAGILRRVSRIDMIDKAVKKR